jgi:hypothetical protein
MVHLGTQGSLEPKPLMDQAKIAFSTVGVLLY